MRDGRASTDALPGVEHVPGVGLCGQRPNQRSWLTDKGARVVALATHPSSGGDHDDDRSIVTDDDGTVYVTDHDGITRAYHQYDDSPSFPRCLPGGHGDAR